MKIPLTQGQVSLVDDDDFKRFGYLKWCAVWEKCTRSFIAMRGWRENGKKKSIKLHRAIMGVTDPRVKVDHKNHDTLDNRRANLRPCTSRQNQRNRRGPTRASTSGFRGVSKHSDCDRWGAYIRIDGKTKYLGLFKTPEEAAAAYATANRQHFGEFGGGL